MLKRGHYRTRYHPGSTLTTEELRVNSERLNALISRLGTESEYLGTSEYGNGLQRSSQSRVSDGVVPKSDVLNPSRDWYQLTGGKLQNNKTLDYDTHSQRITAEDRRFFDEIKRQRSQWKTEDREKLETFIRGSWDDDPDGIRVIQNRDATRERTRVKRSRGLYQ